MTRIENHRTVGEMRDDKAVHNVMHLTTIAAELVQTTEQLFGYHTIRRILYAVKVLLDLVS